MARMNLNSCPRCNGAVLDYVQPTEDSTMCIMCGWLDRTVSESVLTEVKNHLASHSSSTTTHTQKNYPWQTSDEWLGTREEASISYENEARSA